MKYILSTIALFCFLNSISQNLTLYGRIQYYDLPKSGRLYYSLKGEPFTAKQSIQYTNSGDYSFSISIAELRQKGIRNIAFGTDSTSDPTSSESCVHRVHADEILKHSAFANSKSIRVHTDLLITYFCSASVAYRASDDGNGRFTGSYQLQFKDTTVNVQLSDMLYSSGGMFYPANAELMDQVSGNWQYDNDQKKLSIHLPTQWNQALGIALNRPRSFIFHVEEVNGQLRFISDKYTLTRL